MGAVIGTNREHLNDIEQKTEATLKVYRKGSNGSLYVKGSIESQRRAIREIKETVVRPEYRECFERMFLIITKPFCKTIMAS